jgi:WXXGXW repeat (2 copies)
MYRPLTGTLSRNSAKVENPEQMAHSRRLLTPRTLGALTLGLLLSALGGCAANTAGKAPDAPPAAVTEAAPARPGAAHVWLTGYWAWRSRVNAYVWVPGRWEVPASPGAVWVPGHWVSRDGGHVWVEEQWTAR